MLLFLPFVMLSTARFSLLTIGMRAIRTGRITGAPGGYNLSTSRCRKIFLPSAVRLTSQLSTHRIHHRTTSKAGSTNDDGDESNKGRNLMLKSSASSPAILLGNVLPFFDDDDETNKGRNLMLKSSTSPAILLANVLPFFEKAALSAGAVGVGILALLYFKQGDLLYIPTIDMIGRDNSQNPPGYRSPGEYGIPFENHHIQSVDGVAVHSWFMLHPQSKERNLPTIIFFHGNAGNIGVRIPNAAELFKLDANVVLVEYRGYGESKPEHIKPSEKGIKADAEAVLDFVIKHPQVDPTKVFIFGRSLGGAVAFHVAEYVERNNKPLAGIMVENTFESIGAMVDILFPFLSPLKGLLLRNKWDSTALAGKLELPVLYISGDSDEIVPRSQMEDLFSVSKQSSRLPRFYSVKGGTHNETWLQGGKQYWLTIKKFMLVASNAKNV